MNSVWITAWIVSAVLSAGVWLCARRSGLGRWECLAVAVGFFPSPLFVAMGGSNSFIYAFDFAVPFALFLAARRWAQIPGAARNTALWFIVGVGMVPLLVLFIMADRLNLLYSAISFYRLVGALALMCVLSAAAAGLGERRSWMLASFSWMNLVLLVATVLQSQGWINSNVFYSVDDSAVWEDRESMRFITAGLFRGSLGIIGTLGWVAFLAQHDVRGRRAGVALAGGVAGAMVIILCGSKTSLFAVLLITMIGCAVFPQILRHLWGRLTAMMVAVAFVATAFLLRTDSDYFAYTLGALGLADDSFGTLSYRQERWGEAMEFIARAPGVLMGVETPFGSDERGLSYFHNEYITMLMGGGIWSAGAYLAGLLVVARASFHRRLGAGNCQIFAALSLLCGLTQAVTVNHLLPGIFFLCSTTVIACGYGLGFAEKASAVSPSPEAEEWLEPDFVETPLEATHS